MAYFIQQGMGYMDDKQFQEAYRVGGWSKARDHLPPRFQTLTEKQFNEIDNDYIFAALLASIDYDQAGIIVQQHSKTHDGVMTWIHLHDTYDNAGNLQMKIIQLLKELCVPWSDNYPGGINQYLNQVLAAYSKLEREDPSFEHHPRSTEKQRISDLVIRFHGSLLSHTVMTEFQLYETLLQNSREDYNINVFTQCLRDKCSFTSSSVPEPSQKAKLGVTIPEEVHAFIAATTQPNPWYLGQDAWRTLLAYEKELKERHPTLEINLVEHFLKQREQLQPRKPKSDTQSGKLKQYSNDGA